MATDSQFCLHFYSPKGLAICINDAVKLCDSICSSFHPSFLVFEGAAVCCRMDEKKGEGRSRKIFQELLIRSSSLLARVKNEILGARG